jgi:uncharacterized delta-60 repeat protein
MTPARASAQRGYQRSVRAALIVAIALLAAGPAAAAPGDLDPSFAGGGWQRTLEVRAGSVNFLPRGAEAVAVQRDGRIVTAGPLQDGVSNRYFGVFRYLPDGRLDSSFGSGGFAAADLGSFEEARAVAVQRDGKIDHGYGNDAAEAVLLQRGRVVVAGEGRDTAAGDWFGLARLRSDGRLDRSFGRRGHRVVGFGRRRHAFAHALAHSGRGILVAGNAAVEGRAPQVAVARLTSGGALDRSFGRVLTSPGAHGGSALAVRAHGRRGALVAGRAFSDATYDPSDWALLRYSGAGRLDRGFGSGGIVHTDFGTGSDKANALALTSGRAVVAGEIYSSLGVARYITR